MATYRHWSVSLWRDPDDVSHCRILSPDKTEWRLISATLCRWRRCFMADQLSFMTRIQEEEEVTVNLWDWRWSGIVFIQVIQGWPGVVPCFQCGMQMHLRSWHRRCHLFVPRAQRKTPCLYCRSEDRLLRQLPHFGICNKLMPSNFCKHHWCLVYSFHSLHVIHIT